MRAESGELRYSRRKAFEMIAVGGVGVLIACSIGGILVTVLREASGSNN